MTAASCAEGAMVNFCRVWLRYFLNGRNLCNLRYWPKADVAIAHLTLS